MEAIFFFSFLLLLSLFDIFQRKIPVILLWIGSGVLVLFQGRHISCGTIDIWDVFLGMMPGIVFLIISRVSRKVGLGDGLVLMLLGGYLGFQGCLFVLCSSLFFLCLCSLILLALHKVHFHSQMPYLPFVCMGYGILVFCK